MLFLLASGLGVPLSSSTQSVQPELASVVHNTLLKSGIEQRVLDDILAANSTSSGAGIILTFLNEAAIPTWRRQLDLVKEQRLSSMLSRWVIINWDDAAMRACQESAVVQHCALDTQLLDAGLVKRGAKGVLGHEATYHDEKGGVLHQVYARMCWRRVEMAALALWHGVHVTNLDTDVLTFREPFPGGGLRSCHHTWRRGAYRRRWVLISMGSSGGASQVSTVSAPPLRASIKITTGASGSQRRTRPRLR